LLELLKDRAGRDDLYRIGDDLKMELDDLLPIVEAASLLSFARLERGDVEITPAGLAFAEADISARKSMFREEALAHVALLQQMRSCLSSKADHAMTLDFFRDILRERLSDQEVERQLDTALNWGRYSDILTYDRQADRIQLYEPPPPADAAAGEPA
jgi:NitT/TauT family transport system ATP-binding protein